MYRLLGETPGSHKNSRHPARATANEAALKRDKPAGEACKWYGGDNHRPDRSWEASDQQRDARRRSQESGVCAYRQLSGFERQKAAMVSTCQRCRFAVVSD
jgi:hypothetical protein